MDATADDNGMVEYIDNPRRKIVSMSWNAVGAV